MYWLIDQIIVPQKYQKIFLKKIPYFCKLYRSVKTISSVTYTQTRLQAIGTRTIKNPKNSFMLIITFDSQRSFQKYHDHSTLAKTIHQKITKYVGGKQLEIKVSLHGDDAIQTWIPK
jgi:nicotinic acid mononucleotide adenylyltransferase